MKIELLLQNAETKKILEIGELVSSISWSTYIIDQPGKLVFDFTDSRNEVVPTEGSVVSLKVDGQPVFFGYVFKVSVEQSEQVKVTAYDQLRYLKNKDTYVNSNMTASQVFSKVCSDFKLKSSVLDASSYVLPSSVEDNQTLFSIIQKGMDLTLINTGNWYVVRDNFGTLEFQLLNRLKTTVFIGDRSSLSKYSFDSSVDNDTYNQVKLVKENKETQKREVYVVKDSSTISKWGTLQYFETVSEDSNAAQIKSRAEMLLKLKNRKTKTLKLNDVIGSLKVFAGSGIILGIEKLVPYEVALNKYFMVTSAVHTFKNDLHTMSLELQVSV